MATAFPPHNCKKHHILCYSMERPYNQQTFWISNSDPMFPHGSVQLSHSVLSNSLRPHESQHAKPPCPSPTPGVHSDSHPSSQWYHPAISSSVVPFSSCPQPLPASESFPMSQLFAWGGQSTGVSALASFLPKKSWGWSPSEWTDWISLQSKGLLRVFSNTTVQKHHGTLVWLARPDAMAYFLMSSFYHLDSIIMNMGNRQTLGRFCECTNSADFQLSKHSWDSLMWVIHRERGLL